VRSLPRVNVVANIAPATSESWTAKSTGAVKERTEWHRVAFFGKVAEVLEQYPHKGSRIYAEGKLRTPKWQDQNGQDRYTTEVVVDARGSMQILDAAPPRSPRLHPPSHSRPSASPRAARPGSA